MTTLGKIIELDDETRKLYSKYDYKYFLEKNIKANNYSKEDILKIFENYKAEKALLKEELKMNRRQTLLHIDGLIRKSHEGNSLPTLFGLDPSRSTEIFGVGFGEYGKEYANFEIWSKNERQKIRTKNFWDIAIKSGAILGFVLTVIKIIEELRN